MEMARIALLTGVLGGAVCLTAVQADDETFRNLDKNGDGYISAEEAGVHHELTMGYIAADVNGDGHIDAVEFSSFEAIHMSDKPLEK